MHRKVSHKRRARVVHRAPAPQPVKVTFNPFANFVAASNLSFAGTSSDNDRRRYLSLAGFAFALLAAAGLSLHLLSARVVQ